MANLPLLLSVLKKSAFPLVVLPQMIVRESPGTISVGSNGGYILFSSKNTRSPFVDRLVESFQEPLYSRSRRRFICHVSHIVVY